MFCFFAQNSGGIDKFFCKLLPNLFTDFFNVKLLRRSRGFIDKLRSQCPFELAIILYFTGDKFELLARNRVIVQRLRDKAVNRVVLRERSRECLSILRSMFLLRTVRLVEAKPVKAAKPAAGAPMITPTPEREAAIAPQERAAETAPRQTAE